MTPDRNVSVMFESESLIIITKRAVISIKHFLNSGYLLLCFMLKIEIYLLEASLPLFPEAFQSNKKKKLVMRYEHFNSHNVFLACLRWE